MEYVNLGDVATYINGYAFKPEHRGKKGLPIIRIQDLNGNSHDLAFFDGKYPEQVEINTGDILISWSGSLGVYKWNKGKALLNQHIFKVLFNKIEIDKEYFCYAIRNSLSSMSQQTHGATMKHITKKDFDNISIPYPDLIEQKKIANNLNIVNKLIMFYEKELILFEQMVKARFIEMFGDLKSNEKDWDLKTFEEMSVLITDGEHSTPKRTKEGIYLLSARNVLNHSLQLEDVDYINRDEYLRIAKRVVPKKGDILISCSGTIGRCCSIPDSLQLQMVRSVALIRFKEVINPIFAEYMITSDYLQEQINSSKTMSSQANLFQGKIRKLKGFLPPTELQQQFADFVQQVDKSREEVKKSLEKTQQLYDSLMQEYFG